MFLTYRNGNGPIESRIKAAVSHFYQANGQLPAGLVVHKSEVDGAQAAVLALGLALEVGGSGGCLVGEVWLQEPKAEG